MTLAAIHWPKIHWPKIHWIGAGLASGPGIVSLAEKYASLTVWDMSPQQAQALKDHISESAILDIRALNINDEASCTNLRAALNPGDIIISMLPVSFHPQVAELALAENCHMVTSSYLSDEMLALNDKALAQGLSLVNEVGLDPGIDHLLAHILVDSARRAGMLGRGHRIDFISYCGGIPAKKTPFTYKFSWTAYGALMALNNPARMIRDGEEMTIEKPWHDVSTLTLSEELFEVYPNRDSLPYLAEYGLEDEQNLHNFVRGTFRHKGWKNAWQDIFGILETGNSQAIKDLSDRLWREHKYAVGEQDRTLLYVALTITPESGVPWQASLGLDMTGAGWQSALAKTVSLTVAEGVNALREGRLSPGVQSAPHDISEARIWLRNLQQNGIKFTKENVDL